MSTLFLLKKWGLPFSTQGLQATFKCKEALNKCNEDNIVPALHSDLPDVHITREKERQYISDFESKDMAPLFGTV